MGCIGNLIWFFSGGVIGGLLWSVAGVMCCITVIGIPMGIQCFKFAELAFFPFGKKVEYGGGAVSLLANIIWLILPGLEMAATFAFVGILFCITIIGIPFGKQMFKQAQLALMPFGAKITKD